jgi:hypothetical protein
VSLCLYLGDVPIKGSCHRSPEEKDLKVGLEAGPVPLSSVPCHAFLTFIDNAHDFLRGFDADSGCCRGPSDIIGARHVLKPVHADKGGLTVEAAVATKRGRKMVFSLNPDFAILKK